jgi:hypothetical protein
VTVGKKNGFAQAESEARHITIGTTTDVVVAATWKGTGLGLGLGSGLAATQSLGETEDDSSDRKADSDMALLTSEWFKASKGSQGEDDDDHDDDDDAVMEAGDKPRMAGTTSRSQSRRRCARTAFPTN